MRQGAPLAAGAFEVQQSVDDLAPRNAGAAAGALGLRQQGRQHRPLRIGQVRGVRAPDWCRVLSAPVCL